MLGLSPLGEAFLSFSGIAAEWDETTYSEKGDSLGVPLVTLHSVHIS